PYGSCTARRWPREIYARRFPVMDNSLAGQKGTTTGLGHQMAGDATEYPFTEPRMAIGPGNHRAGVDVGGNPVELSGRCGVRFRNDGAGQDTVAVQPRSHVLDMRYRVCAPDARLGNFCDCDVPCPSKDGQRIEHCPPGFLHVLPGP